MKKQEVLRYCLKDEDGSSIVKVTVSTDSIDNTWARFKGRLRYRAEVSGTELDPCAYCKYTASKGYSLWLWQPEDAPMDIQPALDTELWPVIYETNEYWIEVRFYGIDKDTAFVQHVRADVENAFNTVWDSNGKDCTISGKLSFLNEPGIFRLGIVYSRSGVKHEDFVSFYAVSPKLDVKNNYKSMLQTVNRELEKDVFRYLSLTVQQMSPSRDRSQDLQIWMQVFDHLVTDYIKNIGRIIKNPHSKIRTLEEFRKADRIHRWTPAMEEVFSEKKKEQVLDKYFFRNEVYDTTVNSLENRFIKYTLQHTGKRLNEVFAKVLTKDNTEASDSLREKWLAHQTAITRLLRHPFFEAVGRFEGLRHESLVLQSRMGYQQVYKDWLKLKKGIDIFDGATNVGVMQIWEIYELWCFIKVKNMVCRILSNDGQYELVTDEPHGSLIQYSKEKKTDYTLLIYYPEKWGMPEGSHVTLHYQHVYNRRSGEQLTFTTDNRPDIVLNIHQSGQEELTYLFDAKYRVWSDPKLDRDIEEEDVMEWEKELGDRDRLQGADYPPSDAINQMHRYRDAIYYGLDEKERPRNKEIIGGYILFPGRAKGDVTRYFATSIKKINIGAFPLLPFGLAAEEKSSQTPDFEPEGQDLYNHLKDILLQRKTVYSHVKDAVPQRGLYYTEEPTDMQPKVVLTGLVRKTDSYLSAYEGHNATEYIMDLLPSNILGAKYLLPMIIGKIDGYYRIDSLKLTTDTTPQKVVLRLGKYIPLGEKQVNIYNVMRPNELITLSDVDNLYNQ